MTNICLHEALNVINQVIWSPRKLVIHTASAISFVLYRDESLSWTMKNDLGFYFSRMYEERDNTYKRPPMLK